MIRLVYTPSISCISLQNISHERLGEIFEGLKTNTNLDILEMASVALTDRVAKVSKSGPY